MFTDKFKEGRPKSVVVPKNTDTVRELIMQDRHVTYREIKASFDISGWLETMVELPSAVCEEDLANEQVSIKDALLQFFSAEPRALEACNEENFRMHREKFIGENMYHF
ncbi:hypothetical protein EVAR_12980_1 [Eumeta japonica]|uniref:Uncharacterized protein n=1 Tax=Eumeta variegata TaxID=151549 RepID=A0A4C1TWW4_EUMVA|nr:hypothetical protein EVAR_12980_1 [Eumeta japonica]